MPRDYKKENKYKKKPAQIKKRVQRNAARRKMIKAGKAKVGDGKDVAHKDNNTSNNKMSNLKMSSPSKNRSFPRTKTAARKRTKKK